MARIGAIDPEYFRNERRGTFNVIGSTVQRSDARGHVTGRTAFFEDMAPPGMAHLKVHRSTRHHARIEHVDVSAARTVPGVLRVITHEDVPNNWYTVLRLIGIGPDDEPVLAEDRVLYLGEPIVAVVAETEEAAREGAARVVVEYTDLPAVLDVEEALAEDAPVIKQSGTNYFVYEGHHCRRVRFGDVERGFQQADHVFAWRYSSAPIEHAPTETTGCIVVPQGNGRLRIHTNTQAAFFTLDNTALILGRPFTDLQVIGGTVGGGFGGKVDVMVEPLACIAATLTNRPVKFVYSRAEEMQVSSPRAAERIYITDGVMNDGRIIARKVMLYVDAGRILPAQPVRSHQGRRTPAGPVRHSQCLHRLPLRLHQPDPVQRHARLRRHDRRLRPGIADGPDRPGAGHRSARDAAEERLPRR